MYWYWCYIETKYEECQKNPLKETEIKQNTMDCIIKVIRII